MKGYAEVNREDGVVTYLPNKIYATSLYKNFWFPSFNVRGDPLRNVWRNGLWKKEQRDGAAPKSTGETA